MRTTFEPIHSPIILLNLNLGAFLCIFKAFSVVSDENQRGAGPSTRSTIFSDQGPCSLTISNHHLCIYFKTKLLAWNVFRIPVWNTHHSLAFSKSFPLIPNNPPPPYRKYFLTGFVKITESCFSPQKRRNPWIRREIAPPARQSVTETQSACDDKTLLSDTAYNLWYAEIINFLYYHLHISGTDKYCFAIFHEKFWAFLAACSFKHAYTKCSPGPRDAKVSHIKSSHLGHFQVMQDTGVPYKIDVWDIF